MGLSDIPHRRLGWYEVIGWTVLVLWPFLALSCLDMCAGRLAALENHLSANVPHMPFYAGYALFGLGPLLGVLVPRFFCRWGKLIRFAIGLSVCFLSFYAGWHVANAGITFK